MQELIKIEIRDGKQLVSGRELHKFLENNERFSKWWERIISYGFIKDKDFTSVQKSTFVNNGAKKEIGDYLMKISMAKELSMLQRNEKGKQARLYFIECEEKLKAKLPQTYLEALKELVKVEEAKLQLENRVNNLIHSKKLYTTTEIAKELGFKSANVLNLKLEEDKVQYKVNDTWVLTSKYAENDYVSIKQTELESGKIIYDRKWTGLGRDFLIAKYSKGN